MSSTGTRNRFTGSAPDPAMWRTHREYGNTMRTHTQLANTHRRGMTCRGMALMMSLVMLLVLSLVAMGSAQSTKLELKMAQYAADRIRAMHDAEAALDAARHWIEVERGMLFTTCGRPDAAGEWRGSAAPGDASRKMPTYVVTCLDQIDESTITPGSLVSVLLLRGEGFAATGNHSVVLESTVGITAPGQTSTSTGLLSWRMASGVY